MASRGPPSDHRREVTLKKNQDGKFGFSFAPMGNGNYEILKVTPAVSRYIRECELLISINYHTEQLESYCQSEAACSMEQWKLVIETTPHQGPPYQNQPHPGPPYQGISHQDQSHQGQSHQGQSHQGLPYLSQPHQGPPYQDQACSAPLYQNQPRSAPPLQVPRDQASLQNSFPRHAPPPSSQPDVSEVSMAFSELSVGSETSYASLDFSLLPSINGPDREPRQRIVDTALSRPIEIIWSDEVDVRYSQACNIVAYSAKFKKKQTRTGRQWIIVQHIQHTRAVGPMQEMAEAGDQMLRLNGVPVPFECPEGTTAWFRNQLSALQNQPVTLKIRRPIAIVVEEENKVRQRLDSVRSVLSIAPSEPPGPQQQQQRPTKEPGRLFSNSGYNSAVKIPSSINAQTNEPQQLTMNPDFLRGEKMIEKCRTSIELLPIERLSRCRLLFHSVHACNAEVTETLQCHMFGRYPAPKIKTHGTCLKEYHVHASFSESDRVFTPPSENDCFSPKHPLELCSFEMHGPTERVFERTAWEQDRDQLLSLPDHVKSGKFSVGGMRRASAPDGNGKMHLQVLSLTGSSAALHKAWCSPVLYCKHAIHVLVVSAQAFFTEEEEERNLSRVLSEIKTYSKDYWPDTSHLENLPIHANVLLVIKDLDSDLDKQLTERIHSRLRPYLSMLLLGEDQLPFVRYRPDLVSARLVCELKAISISPIRFIYPYVAVMLAQRFNDQNMKVIEMSQFEEMLYDELSIDSRQSVKGLVYETALQYLQNTGIAYVPKSSYSSSIGKGCPTVMYSILIHPHQLVNCVSDLVSANSTLFHTKHMSLASQTHWKELLRCNSAEKIICIMQELHILLPVNTGASNHKEMLYPLRCVCDHAAGRRHPNSPKLVLSYDGNQNLLLISSFLHHLSRQAVTSNVDYHCSSGQFDIYHVGLFVCRTTDTLWAIQTQRPISVADQALCFFIESLDSDKTSLKHFCNELNQCVKDFHSKLAVRPVFGPPCSRGAYCKDYPHFHVINILGPDPPVLSCSGYSLQNDSAITDYVFEGNYTNDPNRLARRDAILNQPADCIPLSIIDQLGYTNILERNWIGLAKEIYNLSQYDIEKLATEEHPARALIGVLALAHNGYTVRQLFIDLTAMERLDLQHDITSWIDNQLL